MTAFGSVIEGGHTAPDSSSRGSASSGWDFVLVAVAYGLWLPRAPALHLAERNRGRLTMLTEILLSQLASQPYCTCHRARSRCSSAAASGALARVGSASAATATRTVSSVAPTEMSVPAALAFADGHLLSTPRLGSWPTTRKPTSNVLQAILSEARHSVAGSVVVVASGCTGGTVDIANSFAAATLQSRDRGRERNGKARDQIRSSPRRTSRCALVSGDTVLAAGSSDSSGIADRRSAWWRSDRPDGSRPASSTEPVECSGVARPNVSAEAREAVAFRRLFDAIDERSLVDEVASNQYGRW
jgi:hypothetical protein